MEVTGSVNRIAETRPRNARMQISGGPLIGLFSSYDYRRKRFF